MRIIDLSAPIVSTPPDVAPWERVELKYTSHAEGAAQIQTMLGVPPELLREGEGWAIEEFTRLGTHSVTHVDAPWHFNSRIQGRKAATIDELPLEWFLADGVVLDLTAKADGEKVEVSDVEAALALVGYALKPLDIVLVRTGRDAFYGRPDYSRRGVAVTADATRWMYERGVRVMGIDAWGWDGPLDRQAEEALANRRAGDFLGRPPVGPALLADRAAGQPGLAAAVRVQGGLLPAQDPGGSAGPARVVAILGE